MHTPMMTPADMYQEIVDQELADIFLDGDSLIVEDLTCLLYTSPSPRDRTRSRMPSSA